MKDFISANWGTISEWYIHPMLVMEGEVMPMPETLYSVEDSSYQQDTWIEFLDNTCGWVSVFYPLLSSFYCNSNMTHFTGCGSGFEGELESFWDNTMGTIEDIREDYNSMDREEFVENYCEDTAKALDFLKGEDIGVQYDTEVKGGRLIITMFFGDCSLGGDKRVSDTPAYFSPADMPEFEYTGDLEELDRGEVPWRFDSYEEFSTPVFLYSCGRYLFNQLATEEDKYADNRTETLYNLITSGVDTDNLSWCELEGSEVTDKWLEVLEQVR